MPGPLNSQQLEEFDRRGVLRMPGLLSAARVQRAGDYVRQRLEAVGLWRDGEWRLDAVPRPQWPDTGLKTSKVIGNKHPDVDALLDEPGLCAAVDQLLDGRAFDRAIYPRPQLLFTLPNADVWTLPAGWHVDGPRLASGRRPGVQLFACLDTVQPRGGGTMVIAGSHRLLNDGQAVKARELRRLLCRDPWFRELYSTASVDPGPRLRLLDQPHLVDGIELELLELCGAPGDAWLMDLGVLHSITPNATARPRMMATHRFIPEDLTQELAETFGWRP